MKHQYELGIMMFDRHLYLPCIKRLPADAQLDMESYLHEEKHETFNSKDTEEEFYVGEDGLIADVPVDDKSRLDNYKLLVDRYERELQQAAEYGLGLLDTNEELQVQVMTLKIQLETETEELSVERDTWQRRTEHAQQETVQWKHKFARVEEEKTILAEEFEQFIDRCKCRGQDSEASSDNEGSMRKCSHHLDTIAQFQKKLEEVEVIEHSKEEELKSLRQWKEMAEQRQQVLQCEVLTAESESLYRKKMEQELSATQCTISVLKNEKDALQKAAQQHEAEMRALKKQLCIAEEVKHETLVQSNRMSEELLSSESRCKRLQRELELLEHVSYFSQASVDRDDEESDEGDENIEVKDVKTVPTVSDATQVKNIESKCRANGAEDRIMPPALTIKRQRSLLAATASTNTAAEDGPCVQVLESEKDSRKKLYHYFHLTALSIIHENNMIDRCFDSSSRLTIDMWYREVIAKEVPFLVWHSWLINRISEVAASVQDDNGVRHRSTSWSKISRFGGAFHGFSLRKISASGDTANNSLPSPATVSSSAASSPVTRIPLTVARAFFRVLRKSTRAGAGVSPDRDSPADDLPAR
ncbi:hypothetical protein DD237_008143 [Peronospora effusa]|uniref:Uncharacterized protein n=1 Tax=Peronospora effusa TaxID=542832 RepID=A0A425C554_9STRA|nr:hypothetical protein DD237_008143 [Peronospora effusa]